MDELINNLENSNNNDNGNNSNDNNIMKKNLLDKAYSKLCPEKELRYKTNVLYSGRFKDYGATILLKSGIITLKLSRAWQSVSEDIQIGLAQSLLVKLFKLKLNTVEMDYYNSFLKNIHKFIPKTKSHPILEESFNRVNDRFFLGTVEQPNLMWGVHSTTKFGGYDYTNDTISISKAIMENQELLDYVMYHEVLHKKHSFRSKNGRNLFHSAKFKKAEKIFPNSEEMERRLSVIAAKKYFPKKIKKTKTEIKSKLRKFLSFFE